MRKVRQGRATPRQLNAMIDYLESHPAVVSGKYNSIHARGDIEECWKELADYLNSLSTDGKFKTVKSWKTTWRDCKFKVSEKVQKLRRGCGATDNNPVNIVLTEFDNRVLGIIDNEYVDEMKAVPDGYPQEFPNAIADLAGGKTAVLEKSTTNMADIYHNQAMGEPFIVKKEMKLMKTPMPPVYLQKTETGESSGMQEMRKRKPSELMESDTSLDKQHYKRNRDNQSILRVQLREARETFQDIANKNADAMQMLAEAMKVQAEAMVNIGEALQKMAKNEERQTKLIQSLWNILANNSTETTTMYPDE